MGITTEHKCDKCGHTQPDGTQMWHVGILFYHSGSSMGSSMHQNLHSQKYWCRPCMEYVGLLGPHQVRVGPAKIEPPPPTIEDMLRELIVEVVKGEVHGE